MDSDHVKFVPYTGDPCPSGDRDHPERSALDMLAWATRNKVRLPECVEDQIDADLCPEVYPDDPYVN